MPIGEEVASRVAAVLRRIAAAAEGHGRSPDEVTVLGASKSQPLERILAARSAGIAVFGENRVQEALAKIPQLPDDVEWHLIGPLQSNKARKIVPHIRAIHSIDRVKIATVLDREAAAAGRRLRGYLEVNVGDEETKHGFRPDALVEQVRPLAELEHLEIVGLMSIPPFETDVEAQRRWFRRLRELRDELCSRAEWSACPGGLSMGTSHDFEVAVEEGATVVRLGTVLFGPRPRA